MIVKLLLEINIFGQANWLFEEMEHKETEFSWIRLRQVRSLATMEKSRSSKKTMPGDPGKPVVSVKVQGA